MLMQDLDKPKLMVDEDTYRDRRKLIVDYFMRTKKTHNAYVMKFLFCESLNLFNIIGQMFLMDRFLGYEFSSFGADVIRMASLDDDERIDPMATVFPKMTKCDFHIYGPSGTIEKYDSLCLLPINIINEKMFVFLWFWFVGLVIWTFLHQAGRFMSLINGYWRTMQLRQYGSMNTDDLEVILKVGGYGDWFLLIQLGKYMHPGVFHDLLADLLHRIDPKRAENIRAQKN